jgi:hypothetical protein
MIAINVLTTHFWSSPDLSALPDNWSTQPYLILAMRPSADVGYFSNCAAS